MLGTPSGCADPGRSRRSKWRRPPSTARPPCLPAARRGAAGSPLSSEISAPLRRWSCPPDDGSGRSCGLPDRTEQPGRAQRTPGRASEDGWHRLLLPRLHTTARARLPAACLPVDPGNQASGSPPARRPSNPKACPSCRGGRWRRRRGDGMRPLCRSAGNAFAIPPEGCRVAEAVRFFLISWQISAERVRHSAILYLCDCSIWRNRRICNRHCRRRRSARGPEARAVRHLWSPKPARRSA